MVGGIRECGRCHITVEDRDGTRYEWASGEVHDCRTTALAWMNSTAAAALSGNDAAMASLPTFIDRWLAA